MSLTRAFVPSLALLAAAAVHAAELGPVGKGTALVTDPAAQDGKGVAVRIEDEGAGGPWQWALGETAQPPGLWRASARMRLHLPDDFDRSRLAMNVTFAADGRVVASQPVEPHLFDGGAAYTPFAADLALPRASALSMSLSWRIKDVPLGEKSRPARPIKPPSVAQAADPMSFSLDGGDDAGFDELADLVMETSETPLSRIGYPAVVLDAVNLEQVAERVWIERVWPEKVHVYPGETNPVSVTLRNIGGRAANAAVSLKMLTGLDEAMPVGEARVTVPPRGTAQCRFEWAAGAREYGHEARAELFVNGEAVHAASEYFTVSLPVWKTAIQGNGFITWYGREHEFPQHVKDNREAYINVEEAFSWQPSSWTDLTPESDQWWAGQNNFHNSMEGLRLWMDLSHSNGIKMITYLFATASGPSGAEWARRYPELVTHHAVGLGSEFHDIEDLRLYDITHTNAALWDHQYGVWHSFGINRGMLRNMEMGAAEVIASARQFGWDGMRYDSQPTWSAMGAEGVHEEFAFMGVADLMRELVPEFYGQRDGAWSGSAVSIRNVRYMKHRFRSELGPRFAIASNYRVLEHTNAVSDGGQAGFDFFRAYCAGGCQVNQEQFRHYGSWGRFLDDMQTQVEVVRGAGGFHGVQMIDDARGHGEADTYWCILAFACGSHPYTYAQPKPATGPYSRFMTRYGEYCWDPAFVPLDAAASGVRVAPETGLLWERFIRQRTRKHGAVQTVVQLITPPPQDKVVPERAGPMPAWIRGVRVEKPCASEPAVWRLSAEPEVRAERLEAVKAGGRYAVSVPEHRLWTVLVWEEQAR